MRPDPANTQQDDSSPGRRTGSGCQSAREQMERDRRHQSPLPAPPGQPEQSPPPGHGDAHDWRRHA